MVTATTAIDRKQFVHVARVVGSWRAPLLLTHTRPDGDALGCLVALRSVLRAGGARPRALLFEPPPARYAWLLQGDPIGILDGRNDPALSEADAVIVLDTCTYGQLEPVESWLRTTALPKVAVDHHVTRDLQADHYLIDQGASAACLILADWAQAADWPLDEQARLALYVGIATDTGWFRFANTDVRTLEAAAALVRQGVCAASVFEEVYQRESTARFRLLAAALGSVELHNAAHLAIMTVTREMLASTGAEVGDTEDLINYPLQIETVHASVLLAEHEDNVIRTSFRSKPPSGTRPDLDVAAVAATFGGGGHRRAAGARVRGTLDEVKRLVIERMGGNA
ncbi:MAG: DHH family phosphoesterase [Planctomycetota bacterium]|jgi:phosphoesterase RecJ-like protein